MSELFSQNFAVNAFNNAFNCPSIEGRFYCSEENEDTIIEYIRSDIVPVLIERYESGEPNDYDNVLVDIKNKIKITCSLKTKVGSMKKSLTKTKNVPKKKFVDLAKKYNISSSGSRKKIAKRLCDLRQHVLTKKEKLLIEPYVPNNKNKKLMMKNLSKKKKRTKRK